MLCKQLAEIVRYLESCPNVNEKVDPVEFWIENEKTYPSLAPVACDLLIIPASSAPIERVFSTAGQITSGKRNRLNDRNLEREMLLKKKKKYTSANECIQCHGNYNCYHNCNSSVTTTKY